MADQYFVDDKPSVRGGPPATGSKPKNTLQKQAGPLPVYGWIIVGVAAIFLYRRINQSGSSSTDLGAVAPSPSQQMGGVFLLPGSGGGAATGTAASGGATVPAALAVDQLTKAYDHDLDPAAQSTNAQLASFYSNTFAKTPVSQRPALAQFFASNAANKNLQLPYLTGTFSPHGWAQQVDPTNNRQRYIDHVTGKTSNWAPN